MKYLKKFEQTVNEPEIGDYVIASDNVATMKGKIVDYMFNIHNKIYMIEGYYSKGEKEYSIVVKDSFLEEQILRNMTNDEKIDFIPKYELSIQTNKYNL